MNASAHPISGGSTLARCALCWRKRRCLPANLDEAQTAKFESRVLRARTIGSGEHLFRVGDAFQSMFAVQSGCFKTYTIDAEGREHVVNFHFAGELIGADAIYPEQHLSSAVALGSGAVCVIPFRALNQLAHELPAVQTQLFRLLSRDVAGMASIAGDFSAEERLAAFLVMVSARMQSRDMPVTDLQLAMSRQDIASYLRLATETVSRLLGRFEARGLVRADRKHITLLNMDGLMDKAACMNPWTRSGAGQVSELRH